MPRRALRLAPLAVLAAENLAVFARHYFGGFGFPWDFVGSYYAAAAYWTEAARHGGVPMWMPFQSMGYPFLLNVQTGLFYPPMWVFPLARIPYTLHAAVVLQCLHVLAGALGAYVLLRAVLRSRREALLGAFVFQLFGGFYSNSEHVDIVRAFAWTPWLLWSFLPARPGSRRLPRRLVLAPLAVYLMASGGYPGNLVAALFLLAVFSVLVALQRHSEPGAWRYPAAAGAAMLVGLAMAAAALGPGWIYRAELLRYHVADRLYRASLSAAHLPGLILENRNMPVDVSMTSTFVGFAVLAGLCLQTRRSWRRLWPFAITALLAVALAAGNELPLHTLLRRLAPPLGYSRFPASDYRGFAALLAILLAAAGWRELRHRRISPGGLLLRLSPVALLAAWSARRVYAGSPFWSGTGPAALALLATAAALAVWRRGRPAAGVLAMLAAISLDAARVLPRIQEWAVPDLMGVCRTYAKPPAQMHDSGVVVAPALFSTSPASRPARVDDPYRAIGYLTGDYALGDFGGPVLAAKAAIAKNPAWLDFMRKSWQPVLVEEPLPEGDDVALTDLDARLAAAGPDPRVRQVEYGIDRVRYRVSTGRPLLLVENEIFFPGWTAAAGNASAVRVNGHFRGWKLPAGDYELETRFRFAHLGGLIALAGAAWLTWIAALVASRRVPWRG